MTVGAALVAAAFACILYSLTRPDTMPYGNADKQVVHNDPSAKRVATEGLSSPASVAPRVGAPRILIVLPHDNYWQPDYVNLRMAFDLLGAANVTVASSSLAPARPAKNESPWGQPVTPTVLLENANSDDYDAVIFSGGYPPGEIEYLRGMSHHAAAKRFLQQMLAQDKVVAGICAGNAVLADAGVLDGRQAAANGFIPQDILASSGARWVWDENRHVVADGRVLTGRQDGSAKQLATRILEELRP
jgi:protease I